MRISVVIPLYNKRDTVARALESVFAQTVQPFEIIVVNDGSTDGSEQIVEQINHPLVRLIHQPNAGVSAARNKGIETALGDWIAFLDADDFWDYDFLETIVNLHSKYSEARVIVTSYRYFYEDKVSNPEIIFEKSEGIFNNYFRAAYSGSPPICTGALCIEKIALIKIGLFPVGVMIGEDLLTWARLSMHNKIAFTNDVKFNYCFPIRIDTTQKFRLPDENDYVGSELKKMLQNEKDKKVYNDLKKYISHWHKMRLHLFVHHSMKNKSWKEYVNCIYFNFFNYKAHLLILYSFSPKFVKEYINRRRNNLLFK